ncbi:xylulokinase [Nocardia terpenica]|uniref:Xylulose kinase n=1 Tax=Nocardia terpenica TaxID=455432 RepID=A0A164MJA8_9NOCA|nr:FGGY family carbohydrate kinase [Nocardia terpenica]KZM73407.1 xylulose kinase [Nocardia terpenica]NQE87420.1 xylulose kinase [Nocardia terpenica]
MSDAATDDLMLGIDVGTTAVKVVAFTVGGRPVAAHTTPYPIDRRRPGWAEQDPLDWWNGCTAGMRAVLSTVPARSMRAIGLTSQVNTHVFTDDSLRPLAPAIVWQDQRCAEIAGELDARFTDEDKIRIWGSPVTLDASFVGARAAWFARTHPSLWARTRWVLGPKDFVAAKLTGRVATDLLAAVRVAGPNGYLPEAVALVDGLADRLPEILEPETLLGRVDGTEVAVGTMDAYSAVFGTRTTEPGRGMICCGTSLVVAGAAESAHPAGGIVSFPPRRGLHVHAGPTQAGGDAVRWWSQVSGLSLAEVFESAAEGSPGVVFTPYLSGERAPLWDADVRASFLGLSSATSTADLSLAVLRGVAMSGRHVLEAVETACGYPLPRMTFSGGGARSPLWAQIHADILERPVERLRVHDSAALGAALLGAVGAGIYPDIESAAAATVEVEQTHLPAPDADRLRPLYEIYRSAYSALHDLHTSLAAWRRSAEPR